MLDSKKILDGLCAKVGQFKDEVPSAGTKFRLMGLVEDILEVTAMLLQEVPKRYVKNVKALVDNVLQPTRDKVGIPIYISSGYRCKEVNRINHGATTSQHMRGEAADIFIDPVCSLGWTLWDVLKLIVQFTDFDQIIWETRPNGSKWIHVSYVTYRKNRHSMLRCADGKTYKELEDPL